MSDGSEEGYAEVDVLQQHPPITISIAMYKLFNAIVSATVRSVLPTKSVELLNLHLGNSLRPGASPMANPIVAAFKGTPRVSDETGVITVRPSALRHRPSGTVISALVNLGVLAFDDRFEVNDQFYMSLDLLDCSREMLTYWMMRYLQDFKPEMLEYFGNENIKSILLMTKPNLKYILTLVAGLMNDDFSNSENLRALWFIMFEWLMLCRYIELFSTVVCNAVQLQSRKTLSMSETCYRLMKKAFREITPLNTIMSTSDDAFQSSLTVFSNSMKEKVRELETIFNAQLMNLSYDRDDFDRHAQALKVMIGFLDRRIGPKEFTKISFPFLFHGSRSFDEILHSAFPTEFLSLIHDLLKRKSVKQPSPTLFESLHEGGILSRLITPQIEYFRKKKELYDTEQKAIRAEIAKEKSKQKLYREKQRTLAASIELQRRKNPYNSSCNAGRCDDSRNAQIHDDSRDAQRHYDSSCYAWRRDDYPNSRRRDDHPDARSHYDHPDARSHCDHPDAQRRYDHPNSRRRDDHPDAQRRYDYPDARRHDDYFDARRHDEYPDAKRRYDSPDARRR